MVAGEGVSVQTGAVTITVAVTAGATGLGPNSLQVADSVYLYVPGAEGFTTADTVGVTPSKVAVGVAAWVAAAPFSKTVHVGCGVGQVPCG